MAEEAKNKASASKFRTSIGGQALIEGVLMRGPGKQAIVVRSPDGLVEKVEELTLVRDKYPVLGLPIIRGAVTFVDSMVKGVKALMFSADYFPDEDVAEPSKFDQWLEKKLGNEKMQKFITALAVFLSLGLTILLFFLLPTFLVRPSSSPSRKEHENDRLIASFNRSSSQTLSAYINVSAVQMSLFCDLCFGTVA